MEQFLLLPACHFIGDMAMQNKWMSDGKGKSRLIFNVINDRLNNRKLVKILKINKMSEEEKDKEEFEVTVDSNIMETVEKIPDAAEIFAEYGLPCAGCAAASYEKISDIIGEFGVDGDEFIEALRKANV